MTSIKAKSDAEIGTELESAIRACETLSANVDLLKAELIKRGYAGKVVPTISGIAYRKFTTDLGVAVDEAAFTEKYPEQYKTARRIYVADAMAKAEKTSLPIASVKGVLTKAEFESVAISVDVKPTLRSV